MSKVFKALEKAEREKARLRSEKWGLPFRDETIKEEAVFESLLHPQGTIAGPQPSPNGMSPWLVTYKDPDSVIAEQIKRIRTHLLHSNSNGNRPRTIMVTSSLSGEGKSLVTANLAVSIAQGLHEYVLLVDSDIRDPGISSFFGQSPEGMGLSDYLAGEVDLSKIILPTGIPKLSMIPGGRKKPNPVELLSSNRMMEMVREVRERYSDRYILFDSTPVLLTNEPTILATMTEGILFIVRHNLTPRDQVKKALNLLVKDKVIGLVFNDFKMDFQGYYGYGYYRKYYSKYGLAPKAQDGKLYQRLLSKILPRRHS